MVFGGTLPKAIGTSTSDDDDESLDDNSKLLEELSQETVARGHPKALYYEDILLMVVRHPETGEDVLATSIKFITRGQTTIQRREVIPQFSSALGCKSF